MKDKYDLIVIGGGPGGYEGAIRAAQLGLKTALVEEKSLGGTCLNRGCIPTKTLMHTSKLYRELQHIGDLGLEVAGTQYDMSRMQERKKEVVAKLQGGIAQLLQANKITLYSGKGTILAPGRVMVTIRGARTVQAEGEAAAAEQTEAAAEHIELEAEKILIATGAKPAMPPIAGLELPGVWTSDDLLDSPAADQVYDPLVIIGGGVIGVELAAIYNDLGCQVTILEAMPRILPGLDREISQNLSMILKKRGINIHTGAKVTAVTRQDESPQQGGSLPRANLQVCFEEKEKTNELAAAGVLVAIGRKPQTDGLFANGLSPQTERGFLVVDRQYQTSLPGIYAVGDVIGGIQLAHAAAAEGISAVEQMAGHSAAEQEMLIPSCVYSDPEIAAVGLTEEAAKQAGRFIKVGKCIMSANGKSLIEDLDRGFIKLIFDGESEVLLGAQLMCGRATDLISELTTAIANKLTKAQLAAVIRPHPTFSEAVTEAVESVDGRAIHIMPRR